MSTQSRTSIVFLLCVGLGLSALAWVSAMMVRLDKAEADAARRAAHEEQVRLALWRMESALSPLIARESARSSANYTSLESQQDALTPHVKLRFQVDRNGDWRAPDPMLAALEKKIGNPERLFDRMETLSEEYFVMPPVQALGNNDPSSVAQQQQAFNVREWGQRTINRGFQNRALPDAPSQGWRDDRIWEGWMTPFWSQDALILARQVRHGDREFVQGCWLNWETLRIWLLEQIESLELTANLAPVIEPKNAPEVQSRMLAALPVMLVERPSSSPGSLPPVSQFTRVALVVVWTSALGLAGAVGLLLQQTLSLSERRAAFVSAVTHELRTPLTTFKMYAEMLAGGMVEESKQREYLETLRSEADRLGYLVENVLAYARLERRGLHLPEDPVEIAPLLRRISERLEERAAAGDMKLVLEGPETVASLALRIDPTALEQILFNLVDNACKYAAGVQDSRIHLIVKSSDAALEIRVKDHGPGIQKNEAKRLFRPFRKSASQAANSAPGVGLGLALSRRLARAMGGRLELIETEEPGACFILRLG